MSMLFTTSWDDGHPMDLRTAQILERCGATGTFYVCRDGQAGQTLSNGELRDLAKRHEIGAHTLTHPRLPELPYAAQMEEMRGSKAWLEDVLGKECLMFAYPYGAVDASARDCALAAGFRGARTTVDVSWDLLDPFLLPTSVQLHTFPLRPILDRRIIQPIREKRPRLRAIGISLIQCRSWFSMATAVFRYALCTHQPYFHLWGHSWSTDQYGMWDDLERFLRFVNSHDGIRHGTNRELTTLAPSGSVSK